MAEAWPLDRFDLSADDVRRRFEWATRQGNPFWLWPDLSTERWQAALDGIEATTREVLAGGSAPTPLPADAEAIGVAGYTSGMGPLLGHWLEQGTIDAGEATSALLSLHLRHNRLRMDRLAREGRSVVEALAGRGIAVTVLKGMHTAHTVFPEPGARPLSDIDLLIAPDGKHAADEAMAALGLVRGNSAPSPPQQAWHDPALRAEPHTLGFVHAEDPWSVDLQLSLNRRVTPGAPLIRLDDACLGEAGPAWPVSPRAQTLAPAPLALHIACHASAGLDNLSLVRLVELALVTRSPDFAWDHFLGLAGKAGALPYVYPALLMTARLAPAAVPRDVLAECRRPVPAAVLRRLDPLSPARAHNVLRCSVGEKLMWTRSPAGLLRQAWRGLVPTDSRSLAVLADVYRKRAWRLVRGTLTG